MAEEGLAVTADVDDDDVVVVRLVEVIAHGGRNAVHTACHAYTIGVPTDVRVVVVGYGLFRRLRSGGLADGHGCAVGPAIGLGATATTGDKARAGEKQEGEEGCVVLHDCK